MEISFFVFMYGRKAHAGYKTLVGILEF